MREEEPGRGDPIGGLAAMRKFVPFEADAASGGLGWVGLEAARYSEVPALEMDLPPLTHHALILLPRPPEELDVLYEGVERHVPPPAGVSAGGMACSRGGGSAPSSRTSRSTSTPV